jgi:hypothetical protein
MAMVPKLQKLLNKCALINKIIAYVKDEGFNLQTCVIVLNFIVSCNSLGLLKPFDSLCFGHALSKVCQYATINEKVFANLNYASITWLFKVPFKNALHDTPPSSLMDSIMSPKKKTTEGEGVGACSLGHITLGVKGSVGVSGWD